VKPEASSSVIDRLERQGMAPAYWDAPTVAARVRSEVVRWRDVVEQAGIKPE
jgi:tripartite-type tricarboxylate transporter receptor subunit TctC